MTYQIQLTPIDKDSKPKDTENTIIVELPKPKREERGCTLYVLFFISILCNLLQFLNWTGAI